MGVHPPEAMMHFLSVSDSPYFRNKITLRQKYPQFYLFPKHFSIFIRQNFFHMTSFSHRLQILTLFSKNLRAFYKLYAYFVSPYFDHLCITQCTYWTGLGLSYFMRVQFKSSLFKYKRSKLYNANDQS